MTSLFTDSSKSDSNKRKMQNIQLNYGDKTMEYSVPEQLGVDEITGVTITKLVKTFKEKMSFIYNSILLEKRVLFLGYEQPAEEVCQSVLAACLLVSPPLSKILHRCFPYSCLTNMDFLNKPGYIPALQSSI
eukprot:UN28450